MQFNGNNGGERKSPWITVASAWKKSRINKKTGGQESYISGATNPDKNQVSLWAVFPNGESKQVTNFIMTQNNKGKDTHPDFNLLINIEEKSGQ